MSSSVQCYAWGRGEDGQLGLGDSADQLRPRLIEFLNDKEVKSVVCGSGHTIVLTNSGEVYTWGRGDDGRLGHGDQGWKHEPRLVHSIRNRIIIQICCGSYHSAAVTELGELFTWGGGMYGKLGHGNENGHSIPRKVETLKDLFVKEVACGSRHTVVIVHSSKMSSSASTSSSGKASSSGKTSSTPPTDVYAWGDRDNGVSGHGETEGHQYFPRLLESLSGRMVCQIAACGFHSAAISQFGEVWTWGEGKFGRLGHGNEFNSVEPKLLEDEKIRQRRIVQVACGGFHTACVTDTGELLTFGGGEHGQLGHGNKENFTRPSLVKAFAGIALKQVTCGWSHTCVLSENGEVYSFGNGDHGKLGHGDVEKVTLPKKIEGLASKKIMRIASYNEHTSALAIPVEGIKAVPNSTLLEDYGTLVDNPLFSDVTFVVENKRIKAHRVIIAARCSHFRAMFESGMKESREPEIKITDTRHKVFLALMHFLYTDIVDVPPEVAIELYVLADLYTLDRLKAQCETIVHRKLCHANAPLLLSVADQNQAHTLKTLCTRYIIRHFEVITKSAEFAILNRELILEILHSR